MALQSPFFGKRDIEPTGLRHATPHSRPAPGYPGSGPSAQPAQAVAGMRAPADLPTSPVSASATGADTQPANRHNGSKLTVGPNIKLKGVEITDCDTLLVEGTVEATMDSRLMQISESGAFKGSADIDIAEIHGSFEGNLTVRQKLVIHATGRVTGKVRYGKLIVEEGGQMTGEVHFGTAKAKLAQTDKPDLQVA